MVDIHPIEEEITIVIKLTRIMNMAIHFYIITTPSEEAQIANGGNGAEMIVETVFGSEIDTKTWITEQVTHTKTAIASNHAIFESDYTRHGRPHIDVLHKTKGIRIGISEKIDIKSLSVDITHAKHQFGSPSQRKPVTDIPLVTNGELLKQRGIKVHVHPSRIPLTHKGGIAITQQLKQSVIVCCIGLCLHSIINGKQTLVESTKQGKQIDMGVNANEILLFQAIGNFSQIDTDWSTLCIKIEKIIITQCGILHIETNIADDKRHDTFIRQIRGRIGFHLIRVHPHEINRRNFLGGQHNRREKRGYRQEQSI